MATLVGEERTTICLFNLGSSKLIIEIKRPHGCEIAALETLKAVFTSNKNARVDQSQIMMIENSDIE